MPRLPTVENNLGERPVADVRTPVVAQPGGESLRMAAQTNAQDNAAVSQQLAAVTDTMTRGEAKVRTREDALGRVSAFQSFNEQAANLVREAEAQGSLSSPEATRALGKSLAELRDKALSSHAGSPESVAMLAERIENARIGYADKVSNLGMAAQKKKASTALGTFLSQRNEGVAQNPSNLIGEWQRWDKDVDDAGLALPDDEREAQRLGGRAAIAQTSLDYFLDSGAYDDAEKILSTPGVTEVLTPDMRRKVQGRLITGRIAQDKERRVGEAKLREAETIKGAPLTPAERLNLAGLAPKEGRQTLSDKVRDFEIVVKRPATQAEIAKMAGASTGEGGGDFGNSLTGKSLNIVTEDAPAYAAGLLNEAEERRFESAYTQLLQPVTYQNPDTGLMETRRPDVPAFVTDAVRRRKGEVPPAAQAAPGGQPGAMAASAAPEGQPTAGDAPAASGASPQGTTVWEIVNKGVTGPVPAAIEAAGRTPGLGNLIGQTETTRARNYLPQIQRDLVRVLQNNPRYAEGERQAIEKDTSIQPEFFDTTPAMLDRLLAMDQALEVRENNAFNTSRSNAVGREERVQAMNVLNALRQFRENLGIPPRVKTPDEARKLPKGSQFIDPAGNIRTVP